MKRHKSTMFDSGNEQNHSPVQCAIPVAPPISCLLRRNGGVSPKSPASPTLPETTATSYSPLTPVSLPTLPVFNFNARPMVPVAKATHKPQQHSRDSSMASISSASTDDCGASLSSISGSSSDQSTQQQRMRARPHRVWTAQGYRYPAQAPAS